jgi:hypothetical protein
MGNKTGKITYNVTERGRAHIGKDRKFDLRALAALVNGPVVQERVKNRDLLGYYGHHIRLRFGIMPPEWVMMGDKQITIEPALVTTSLQADENGNIEHESEFLDTDSGKVAERLHASRTGGFSSAIKAESRYGSDVPTAFGGFDYVFEPNFTANRGYVLDSTADSGELLLDSVMSDWNQQNAAMNVIFDSLQSDHMLAMQTITRMREENEELLSLLAASKTVKPGTLVLDSTGGHEAPLRLSRRATDDFTRRAASFHNAPLAGYAQENDGDDADAALNFARAHYGK